jgi:FkbM family methyltransferase
MSSRSWLIDRADVAAYRWSNKRTRGQLHRAIASIHPTEKVGISPELKMIWRLLYYTIRPAQTSVMRARSYRLNVTPNGGTLTRSILLSARREPAQTRAFAVFLAKGDFAIDAGANFGHYSLVAAGEVCPSGLVVAFEPNPTTFALLQSNIDLLPYANVVAENAGLSDVTDTQQLVVDAKNPGGHSFIGENVERVDRSVPIPGTGWTTTCPSVRSTVLSARSRSTCRDTSGS